MTNRRDARTAVLFAAAAFVLYLSNFRVITDGDSIPARYLPFAVWGAGSLTLDSVADPASRHAKGREAYWLVRSPGGPLLSLYPIVTPVMLFPLYGPLVPHLNEKGWTPDRIESLGIWMEKLCAAAIAAASGAVVLLLLRRRLPIGRALALATAYAAGTGVWPVASQALWQHGTAQLLLAAALLGATSIHPGRYAFWIGAACGLMALNRPPDAILAGLLAAGVVWTRPAAAGRLIGGALAGAAPFLFYNWNFFGNLAGGYGAIGLARPNAIYGHPLLAGSAGLLASPARGLLVFSPFLLFLFLPAARTGAEDDRRLDLCLTTGLLLQLLFYAQFDWRGGAAYGPRFLLDGLPACMWLLARPVARLRATGLRFLLAAVAVAIVIQAIGAYCYPRGRSDDRFYPKGASPLLISDAVWSWPSAPFVVEARAGLARPELLFSLRDFLRRRTAETPSDPIPPPPAPLRTPMTGRR